MITEGSFPAGTHERTGYLLRVGLISPGYASKWQTCMPVPLLKNPLQVLRHRGWGCGGCIFLFIIDDPDPDRQHTTHVIWIHSWFQMHALVWTRLWASAVCGAGTERNWHMCMWASMPAWESVCMWSRVSDGKLTSVWNEERSIVCIPDKVKRYLKMYKKISKIPAKLLQRT